MTKAKTRHRLKMVYRDPKELIPYEDNPRVNDHVVPFLDNSIDKFDFLVPVIIDQHILSHAQPMNHDCLILERYQSPGVPSF